MSNFTERLDYLLKWEPKYHESHELAALLINNAPAIRDLVVAAEQYYQARQVSAKCQLEADNAIANFSDPKPYINAASKALLAESAAENNLVKALAKLEEA